jgi:hypothetical protein
LPRSSQDHFADAAQIPPKWVGFFSAAQLQTQASVASSLERLVDEIVEQPNEAMLATPPYIAPLVDSSHGLS